MSVRSVPPVAAGWARNNEFARTEFARTEFARTEFARTDDAMSEVFGSAYRPRQTFTLGRDRVLDISSNYRIEAIDTTDAVQTTTENVFLNDNIKVDCALMTQNSKYVVTGNAAGPAQVWDCANGDLIKVMDGVDVGCTDIHLACGDSVLLGMVLDESIGQHRLQMWDFAHGREVAMPEETLCSAIAVNRTATIAVVASIGADGSCGPVLVWDISANQATRALPPPPSQPEPLTFLRVSREEQFVVAGFSNPGAAYLVYDLSLPVGTQPIQVDFDAALTCTELGAGEAVTGTAHGELLVWTLGSGHVERPIVHSNGLRAHSNAVRSLRWSCDGRICASAGADCVVRVWDMTDETLSFELDGHTDEVQSLYISEDNELLVSSGLDGSIRVWKLEDGSQLSWFTSNIEIFKVMLSRDKRCIAALGERVGNRKLIMLQLIRQKSRQARPRNQQQPQAGHVTLA